MTLAQEIVDLLNSMMKADPVATHALIINRMPCNQAMADHPFVIVDSLGDSNQRWVVGLLGVLNGLLLASSDGRLRVTMMFDEDDRSLLGFTVVESWRVQLTPGGA